MEQVIVTKPSGATIELFNRANGTTLTKAELRKTLMGENVAVLGVQSAVPLQFGLGDRLTVFGQPYKLNSLPVTNKKGNRLFAYELTFEGVEYDLLGVKYFDAGPDGSYVQGGGFPLTGNLRKFLDVLVYNTRRKFSPGTWVVGDCPVTDYRDMLFNGENCLSALQRLCAEYKQEFEVVSLNGVNTIHVREVGVTLNNVFEYGRGKGLYGITRKMQEKKTPVTVLYAYGSGKNLRSDYRNYSQRLKLPNNTLSKITDQALVDSVGYFEEEVVFENIFPRRTGTVTALGSDYTKFADTVAGDNAMFDLNATDGNGSTLYLIADKYAKVHFNTGKLAGYEFDISAYNHASKTFTIIPFTDERGQKFPDDQTAAFRVGVGDEYVILDIRMPQTYIDAAEQELQAAAELYYAQNSGPKPEYDIVVDDLYMRDHAFAFSPGDQVHIRDIDMGIDGLIRVKGIVRDLLYPNKFKLTVTDNLEYSRLEKLLSQQSAASAAISSNGLNNTAKTVRNGTDMTSVLTIFAEMFEKRTDSTGKPFIYAKSDLVAKGGMMMYGAVEANIPSLWDGLPIASTTVLGGIKVGANLTIDANGVLNASAGSGVSSWTDLQNKPSWLQPTSQGAFEAAHAHPFSQLTNKPTTLAGYGITDAASSTHTHTFAALTSKPTTIAGFGITDAYTKTNMQTSGAALLHWGNLTNVPATFAPSAHSHATYEVTGLDTILAGKEPLITKATGYAKWTGSAWAFANEAYSLATHLHAGTYEPAFASGSTAQYRRGDKTWQTLNTAAVPESGNLYYTQARFDAAFGAKSTDNLTEGLNLYYTQARFDAAFIAKSTTNLSEGTNLYFTNARALAAISGNATKVAGQFYTGTTNPTNTNRLNYDGYLYATRLYSGAIQVATLSGTETLTNKTLTTPTLTTPRFVNGGSINDSNGNELIKFGVVASAVNEITLSNATTTNPPSISSTGNDANINLQLQPKGSGIVDINSSASINPYLQIKGKNQWFGAGTLFGGGTTNDVGLRNDSGAIYFGNDTPKLKIESNGNVGIGTGTATPYSKLDVNGNITVIGNIKTGNGGGDYAKEVEIAYNTTNDWGVITAVHQNTAFKPLQINPYGANVGIGMGTTAPQYQLDVNGTIRSNGNVITQGGQFRILDASGNIKWSIGFNSTNNDLVFYNATGAKAASIDQSGNLYQVGTVIMYSTR